MSTVAAPRRAFRVAGRSTADRADSRAPWLRLAAFVGLGGYAAAYWASFVVDTPGGRVFWVLAIATALGAGLIALGRAPLPRPALHAAAALLTLVALGVALVAIGLPGHFLKPAHWDDFANLIDRGFSGLRTVTWPYGGEDPVTRLVIMLAIPPVLVLAAALAFWPTRRQGLDSVALVLLVALFGVAITDQSFGAPIGRGLILLVLIAAWLWLPRLGPRTALAGAVAVLAAGILALPVAAVLNADKPWIDYYSWGLGGKPSKAERFDWNHRYGPINWPRTGRTLLMVKSADPHYWKAETLDYFDGLRWSHTAAGDRSTISSELPEVTEARWTETIRFSVRQLRSDLVIGAGTIIDSTGDVGGYAQSSDGTARIVGDPLQEGDSYSVQAYVPDPTAAQMKAAPDDWGETLRSYVTFSLPRVGENALRVPPRTDASRRPFIDNAVQLPFRSEVSSEADRATIRQIRRSPYARTYLLARKLARNAPTSYEVVDNIEKYLQRNMRYSERVPSHEYPLPAFLFQDKVGYCQQFSGAMALMLRMNGIPARVAGGFAPGIYEQSTKEYRVRDLDAHSWVEVYFAGIGWVPFDPTPTTSPAGSQSGSDSSASAARGGRADRTASLEGPRQNEVSSLTDPGTLGTADDSTNFWVFPVILFVLALLGGAGVVAYSLLHERRHHRGEVVDAQLAELEAALRRMGHDIPAQTTLNALERRLTRLVGPAAGRYARMLRERRYGPTGASGPGRAERAALRRELGAAGGRLGRIRALLALPPRRHAA